MFVSRTVRKFAGLPKSVRSRLASAFQATTDIPQEATKALECPVCSYNEWDPLEEVIVGRPEGARIPELGPEVKAIVKPDNWKVLEEMTGKQHEAHRVRKAIQQANEFCNVLELEGVKVRRPEMVNWCEIGDYKTADFKEGGLYTSCPRDSLLVIGNEIIEAPMSWKSRYFETRPYKKLLNEYFKAGALWTLAPKPTMTDHMYKKDFPYFDLEKRMEMCKRGEYILTEAEIAFDAADITRCGLDIFVQISCTTNYSGYEWLRRHLGQKGYRVHALNIHNLYAMHMDCSFVPLKAGIWIMNPDRYCAQSEILKRAGWDIVEPPRPSETKETMYTTSWLSMNTLNLDEERIICYSKETKLIDWLKRYGMKPIPVDMTDCFWFGGGFHCWTVDIRRRGNLQSYFDWNAAF